MQKGINSARADDTKGLKGAIVDWITPPGQTLEPSINRKVKSTRGFHHERTGALLCPAGLDWSSSTCLFFHLLVVSLTLSCHRIKEQLRSGEMQISGDQWPLFLYADLAYDPEDPWNGLLRNQLLITVGFPYPHFHLALPLVLSHPETSGFQAYLHVA